MEQNPKKENQFSKISLHESDLFRPKKHRKDHQPQSDAQSNKFSFFDMKQSMRGGGDRNLIINTVVNINKYTLPDHDFSFPDKNISFKNKKFEFHEKNIASMNFQDNGGVKANGWMSMGTQPKMTNKFEHNISKEHANGLCRLQSDTESEEECVVTKQNGLNITKSSNKKRKIKKNRRLRGRYRRKKKKQKDQNSMADLNSNIIAKAVQKKFESHENIDTQDQNKNENLNFDTKRKFNEPQIPKSAQKQVETKPELYLSSASNQFFQKSNLNENSVFLMKNNSEISFKAGSNFGLGSFLGKAIPSQYQGQQSVNKYDGLFYPTEQLNSISENDNFSRNFKNNSQLELPQHSIKDSVNYEMPTIRKIQKKSTGLSELIILPSKNEKTQNQTPKESKNHENNLENKLKNNNKETPKKTNQNQISKSKSRKTSMHLVSPKLNSSTPKSEISKASQIPESAIWDLDTKDTEIKNFLEEIRVQKALTRRHTETNINDFEHRDFDKNFYKELREKMHFNQELRPIYEKRGLLDPDNKQPIPENFSFLDVSDPTRQRQVKKLQDQMDACYWATKKYINLDETTTDLNGEDFTFTWKGFLEGTRFFNERNVMRPCLECGKYFSATGMGGHMSRVHNGLSKNYTYRKRNEGWRNSMKKRNKVLSNMQMAS